MGMTKTAKQFVGLFLIVAVLGVLAWRLWPDSGRARQQQRNSDLVRAVIRNHLADATRLLDEGADPNTQIPSFNTLQKAEWYLYGVSHRMKPPTWRQMDDMDPHWSLLNFAAVRGNTDMVSVLLLRGADVGYRDRAGETALVQAKMRLNSSLTTPQGASSTRRIIALLRAAEARQKKARQAAPLHIYTWKRGASHPAPILPSHRPMAKTIPPPMMTCTTVWARGLFMKWKRM